MVGELDIILEVKNKLNLQEIDLRKYKRKIVEIKKGVSTTIFVDLKFSRRTKYRHKTIEGFQCLVSAIEYESKYKEYFVQFNYMINREGSNIFYTSEYTTKIERQKINNTLIKNGFIKMED